jgi:hypothetical protein
VPAPPAPPAPPALRAVLRSFRLKLGGTFGGVDVSDAFGACQAPLQGRLGHWLREAEKHAKLPKLDGSLWDAYRRAWATSREKSR